jgi:hypothetical protein
MKKKQEGRNKKIKQRLKSQIKKKKKTFQFHPSEHKKLTNKFQTQLRKPS